MAVKLLTGKPQWMLSYRGENITSDISEMVLAVSYTDYLDGLSGEIQVVVEDSGGLWQGPWFPALGDQVSVMIGYEGEALLPCGDFQIDEVELSSRGESGGDAMTMRGLAAYITPAMRTANSAGYEGQSLLQIARQIAGKYGMQVVSAPEVEDLGFARVTQKHESDLAFLKRLAREHGYDFTARGTKLVFYSCAALENSAPLAAADRSNIEQFELRNRTYRTYGCAEVAFQDPFSKKLITQSVRAASAPGSDRLKLTPRCENAQQALVKAQAALHERNLDFAEGILRMPGSTAFSAGVNMILSDFGKFDGTYMVMAAVHNIDRVHGYTTEVEIRRVA